MKSNTYPTGWTDSAGNAFTNQINNGNYFLPVTPPDFTDAYFLGWIAWDDVPSTLKIFRQNTVNGVWTARPNMTAENVDVGYMARPSTTLLNNLVWRAHTCYSYDATNTRWRAWSNLRLNDSATTIRGRLPNDVDINTNAVKNVTLSFAVSIDSENDTNVSYGVAFVQMPIDDFIYKTGVMALSATNTDFFNTRIEYSVTVDFADLDGKVHTAESGSYRVTYALCYYSALDFLRDIKRDGTGADYDYFSPFFRLHADFDGVSVPYVIAAPSSVGGEVENALTGGGYRFTFGGGVSVDGGTYSYDLNGGRYFLTGGYSGDAAYTDIRDNVYNNGRIYQPENANFIFQGCSRTDFCMIRRVYSYDEIYKHFSLISRWTTGDNSYDNSASKYYPLVDGTHFLCDFANGVRDRARLTEWERVGERLDPETSAYDPADKPPYDPGEDDDEKIGDSIGFNVNVPGGTASGLYTMYALRQTHVNNLGAALWTSFNSPESNFWQNVRMAAGLYEEAGSFDLSTILDFIASIRIYPFALINLPGYVGAGTGAIKMGTGKIPLDLSAGGAGNVGIMGSYTGIIDAGSVTIPAHYGDFRDLEGVTMSVYLPYIGNVTLNPAEVTGQTLQATYAVDLTSGACVAYLLLSGTWGYYPIGVYSGTIGADIPLTASQGNRMFLRDLKNVLGLGSILGGSLSGVDATDGDALAGAIGSGLASGGAYMAKNIYNQGMGSALTPPTLGGGGANFAGFGAPQTAYVQIRRHLYAYNVQTFPASHMGRRSYGVKVLGTLSGFTVCDAVDVSGIPAPADIQTDIKNALESGVYL